MVATTGTTVTMDTVVAMDVTTTITTVAMATAMEWAVTTTTTTVDTADTEAMADTEDTITFHPSTSCTKNKITNVKLASGIKICITITDVDTMDKTTMVTKTTTPVTDIIKHTQKTPRQAIISEG